jgi:predicted DNA-binding transcriptional regulator YafY
MLANDHETLKYVERYQRMQNLICAGNTGNSEEFAAKVGLSRRMLFNYLDDLRHMGLEIEYCRKRKTYFSLSKKIDFLQ